MKSLKKILKELDISKYGIFYNEYKLFKPILDRESKKNVREVFEKEEAREFIANKLNLLYELECKNDKTYNIDETFKSIIECLIKHLGQEDAKTITIDIENRFSKFKKEHIEYKLEQEEKNLFYTKKEIEKLKIKKQELSNSSEYISNLF